MILLALSSGRRLGLVQHSGAAFLQTLLWIVYAAVCGTEQYFNVEVRAPGFLPPRGPAAPETLRAPLGSWSFGTGCERCRPQPRPEPSFPGGGRGMRADRVRYPRGTKRDAARSAAAAPSSLPPGEADVRPREAARAGGSPLLGHPGVAARHRCRPGIVRGTALPCAVSNKGGYEQGPEGKGGCCCI